MVATKKTPQGKIPTSDFADLSWAIHEVESWAGSFDSEQAEIHRTRRNRARKTLAKLRAMNKRTTINPLV